jgi:hypothetical protein
MRKFTFKSILNNNRKFKNMANQKQAQQTLKANGQLINGLQCDASGGLRMDVAPGRLTLAAVQKLKQRNPGAKIADNRI